MKIGAENTILDPFEICQVSTKITVVKMVPAFHTLPLQMALDPVLLINF